MYFIYTCTLCCGRIKGTVDIKNSPLQGSELDILKKNQHFTEMSKEDIPENKCYIHMYMLHVHTCISCAGKPEFDISQGLMYTIQLHIVHANINNSLMIPTHSVVLY